MHRNIIVSRVDGRFDEIKLKSYLEARPDVAGGLRDRHGYELFLVCEDPLLVDRRLCRWKVDAVVPRGGVIYTASEKIYVIQEEARDEDLVGVLAFLKWLLCSYDCRVVHDGYEDMTEEIRAKGIDSFYPEEVRGDRAPWRKYLIQIGFYVDNQDSRGGVPIRRLANEIADSPQADEDALVAYLRQGHLYRRFRDPEDEVCDIFDHCRELGEPAVLYTDGAYVWPSDLAYYVERYHARLPKAFWHHARNNGWRVPPVADVSALKMIDEGEPIPE